MKFILVKYKKSYIIITLFFIILLCASYFTLIYMHNYTDLPTSTSIEDNFENKILNLTTQKGKIVYLTFDDGPTLSSTPKILDILNKENIKASFFVIGKYVKKHPELVKQAYDEGHYIANHTYNHDNSKLYSNPDFFINEIKSTDLEIGNAIGVDNYSSHVFRFPNGYMAPLYKKQKQEYAKLLSNLDYAYIDWNCLNKDSEKKYTNSELLDNLKKSCKDKETLVILMHDTSDVNKSYLVLQDSINYLKEQGYTFKNFYDVY